MRVCVRNSVLQFARNSGRIAGKNREMCFCIYVESISVEIRSLKITTSEPEEFNNHFYDETIAIVAMATHFIRIE